MAKPDRRKPFPEIKKDFEIRTGNYAGGVRDAQWRVSGAYKEPEIAGKLYIDRIEDGQEGGKPVERRMPVYSQRLFVPITGDNKRLRKRLETWKLGQSCRIESWEGFFLVLEPALGYYRGIFEDYRRSLSE